MEQNKMQVGDRITLGRYPFGKNGEEQNIEWRVLTLEGDQALVVSEFVLDYDKFHTWSAVIWRDSLIRQWAQDFFETAFTQAEKTRILLSAIRTSDVPVWSDDLANDPGVETQDYVFLLSMQEAEKHFTSDKDRMARATLFVQNKVGDIIDPYRVSGWWLRNRGFNVSYASDVLPHGEIDDYGEEVYEEGGIRPAMWIKV